MNYHKGNLLSTSDNLTTVRNMSTVYFVFYWTEVRFFSAFYRQPEISAFLIYFDTYRWRYIYYCPPI